MNVHGFWAFWMTFPEYDLWLAFFKHDSDVENEVLVSQAMCDMFCAHHVCLSCEQWILVNGQWTEL